MPLLYSSPPEVASLNAWVRDVEDSRMIRPPELSGASPLAELVSVFQAMAKAAPLLRTIDYANTFGPWLTDLDMTLQRPGIMGISTPWVRHTAFAVIRAQQMLDDTTVESATRAQVAIKFLNGHCANPAILDKCVDWIRTNYHVK